MTTATTPARFAAMLEPLPEADGKLLSSLCRSIDGARPDELNLLVSLIHDELRERARLELELEFKLELLAA